MENMFTHYCPICGQELNYFPLRMTCSCGYWFPNKINDREITEAELMAFEKNSFSPVIDFTTKQGKPCKVRLILNKREKKVDYSFINKY